MALFSSVPLELLEGTLGMLDHRDLRTDNEWLLVPGSIRPDHEVIPSIASKL
jgi:hypothetical protein